ncbi:MAG TPA: monovalent cation/H+ antiporter complex subunit F [Terriglobales bacterium]|nr:monovalent cation/H+ antiporter complex subunit F [Terriglobales bacterium]
MNAWLVAAAVLMFALLPCGVVVFRGDAVRRVVGLEMTGVVIVMVLLMLAEGVHNVNFYDLALATALLAFGGGLVFIRFLERWL